jgi:uncharacterized protein (DUF433 family)
MSRPDKIVVDSDVCGGRPRLKGTRLTVEFLLGLKTAGWTEQQILENYPHITADDLKAVFAYALAIIEEDEFRPSIPAA